MKPIPMPITASADEDLAILDTWRQEGPDLVRQYFVELEELLDQLDRLIDQGRHAEAAAWAHVTANHSVMWHPGMFVSPRLEDAVRRLGEATLRHLGPGTNWPSGRPLRVLHVATRVTNIGGLTRMLWRWIGLDDDNMHSLALTRQVTAIPPALSRAVSKAGGRAVWLNRGAGNVLSWARRLQEMMSASDIVVLHVHNYDAIPFLALAGLERRPPVILLNHSDHAAWMGPGFVDLVANVRRSGLELSLRRRGLGEARNVVLPICVEPMERTRSRAEAKAALGLPADSVVLLTIARAVKYRPMGRMSFADALVPVLKADPRAILLAVGPGGSVDWSGAAAQVPGRIHAFSERPDTKLFYEAADIYVDSFPFASLTSLFEAGLHELPLVTRFPFGPDCRVIGADSLGLDGTLLRTEDLPTFQSVLLGLVRDEVSREQLGRRTRAEIEATNMGEPWRQSLQGVYRRAFELAGTERPPRTVAEAPEFTDLDLFQPFIFNNLCHGRTRAERMASAMEADLKLFPLSRRLPLWLGMASRGEFVYRDLWQSWRYLMPEWLTCWIRLGRLAGDGA